MESRLLEILVCPLCKSTLRHDQQRQELICHADRLAFPIRDGVPLMLEGEARKLEAEPAATASPKPQTATPPTDSPSGQTS